MACSSAECLDTHRLVSKLHAQSSLQRTTLCSEHTPVFCIVCASVQVHLPRHNASIVTAAPHLKCAAVNARLQVGIILLQLLNVSLAVLVQAL